MTNTRRAEVMIHYKGIDISKDLAPFLSSFTFRDAEGRSDDIAINLQDREGKWHGPWLPVKGDKIVAKIRTHNWWTEGVVAELHCGTFFVDDVSYDGPPDKVSVKALAIPIAKGGKNTKNSRTWENAGLVAIAGAIAEAAGLSLLYDGSNFIYDRVVQSKETDLAFIRRLAKKEGLGVKVTKEQLILFDEAKYEAKKPVLTFEKGDANIQSYSFNENANDKQYVKVVVSYLDSKTKRTLKYTYHVPEAHEGPTLKVNKRANTLDEAIRWARIEARDKNKGAKTGRLTITGHTGCVQGMTCNVKGFGAFNGKYIIDSTTHSVGNKYTVQLEIREVLKY
ncbi:MAG: contractile injection system protein, VgrG/Pvc8 family [Solibacillus sp.]